MRLRSSSPLKPLLSVQQRRLRAYIGYSPVRKTLPNTTHYALAALQHAAVIPRLITQNVDGLHHKAIRRVWDEETIKERMLELHGSIFVRPVPALSLHLRLTSAVQKVQCRHGHEYPREVFQDWLGAANPRWKTYLDDMERQGIKPKTNPDGDVRLVLPCCFIGETDRIALRWY